MSTGIRHPIFARFFVWMSRGEDEHGVGDLRRELLRGLEGRVVEVGAGHGNNFPHYPRTVGEVVAVEPEPHLRGLAEQAAGRAPVPVHVVAGRAEQLPLEDESFDAAVVSGVLCSVADPGRSLAEIRRVLVPGGELRFWEHVRAEEPRLERVQRLLDPAWQLVSGGCHLRRETAAAIEDAGFTMDRLRRFRFEAGVLGRPTSPQIVGVARSPTA
jgi:ubiquinone/menaquinone biosynthesis C-methylase UbiE